MAARRRTSVAFAASAALRIKSILCTFVNIYPAGRGAAARAAQGDGRTIAVVALARSPFECIIIIIIGAVRRRLGVGRRPRPSACSSACIVYLEDDLMSPPPQG